MVKARFSEGPRVVRVLSTPCTICHERLIEYAHGAARLTTCPAIMAGGGFHVRPALGSERVETGPSEYHAMREVTA